MSSYRRQAFDQVEKAKELYDSLPEEKVKQFYNLHYCYRRHIPKEQWMDVGGQGNIYSQYFLKYVEGSFTRKHTDNEHDVGETVITLIDKEDLEGGNIVIYEPHFKDPDWQVTEDNGMINWYKDEYIPGQQCIPVVLEQEVGESLVYDHATSHSVSKVLKGTRTVLVTWYKRPKKVLLVGNGTSILDNKLGSKIDSFDNVVRFNSYTTEGYEEYTGTKTDIWFTCMDKHMNKLDEYKQVIVHSWFDETECDLYSKLKDKRSDISKIKDFNSYGLEAPSTGLIAIDYFLSNDYEVYLHGFDWWERKEHHYADSEERGTNHEPDKEYDIINELGVKFLN